MATKKNKYSINSITDELKTEQQLFSSNIESQMLYKSNYFGDLLDFEWLEEIENTCPHIDLIVKNPKLTLIKEEEVVKMEKSKKITVETIKDLTRHTNYINKYDEDKNKVEPKKLLMVLNEETFNIYENRFLYTLIDCMERFITSREAMLKDIDNLSDSKFIEYAGQTITMDSKVSVELKISSEVMESNHVNDKLKKEIKDILKRIKRVKEYISSWKVSEMYKELERQHVKFIQPPIKKTNIILKNPHFALASKLWDYLRKYDLDEDNENIEDNLNKQKDDLHELIDHSFYIDYCVLNSINKYKKDQKQKMSNYAVLLLTEEINKVLRLLQNNGFDITDEELMQMIVKELKNMKNTNRLVGLDDVKNKFKSAMDEYLERTQDYL